MERSKKKVQLWQKAIVHFLLCFVMGFFSGFAPTGKSSLLSGRHVLPEKPVFNRTFSPEKTASTSDSANKGSEGTRLLNRETGDGRDSASAAKDSDSTKLLSGKTATSESTRFRTRLSEQENRETGRSVAAGRLSESDRTRLSEQKNQETLSEPENQETGLPENQETGESENQETGQSAAEGRLLILVTAASSRDRGSGHGLVWLRRMANTVRLVGPPVVWIVVEAGKAETPGVAEMLRRTGVMYRHLVMRDNVTDEAEEMEQQRNLALRHIEHHRLTGVVHFAGLNNVYDLDFFDELREIEVFGTWPMAILSPNRSRVIIEGPVCDSSQVLGWHLKKMNNETDSKPPIHISGFAFNSSILWDPERWGRPSADQDVSQQNSINFVKQVVLEDEAKVKGMPLEDCSRVLLWHLKPQIGSSSPLSSYLPLAAISGEDEDK